ncbi:MAG: biotin--[acetyl-CoA-carboxylase] ligase, partial [Treponema sp.]|nr:biotin--[acetyl-CoA-carboxylase] ligase [Treponema sp.]
MKILPLNNPFGAPVYHEESVSSTMDTARDLARKQAPHGTVITVDFQEAGRGRSGRSWITDPGKNLLFTILLRYKDIQSIPAALTLRTGLAVSLAVEDLAPSLCGSVTVKWPN